MMKAEAGTPPFGGSGYMDDEFYEDTGELQLPRKDDSRYLMLSRIPDWLYEHVSNWDALAQGNDDDEIVLGEVLTLTESHPQAQAQAQNNGRNDPPKPPSMRVFFNDEWRAKSGVPTAFELEGQSVNQTMLSNTYFFTEKDLPGYKPNAVGHVQNKPGSFNGAVQDPKARITKPRNKYKKAIPKQTALIGNASTQYFAKPLNTAEFIAFNAKRTKQAIQGANSRTEIMETQIDEITAMNKVQNQFASFGRSTTKPKSQQNKFQRMPKDDLYDLLHELFDEYRYWGMAQIKQKTRQPEAYLKEVLPTIAELIKSGPFASKWQRTLKWADRGSLHDQEGGGDLKIEDDDEEEEMEDVV